MTGILFLAVFASPIDQPPRFAAAPTVRRVAPLVQRRNGFRLEGEDGEEVELSVEEFPKLVALCAGGLKHQYGSRSLRKLWNRLQDRIRPADSVAALAAPRFSRFDLVPRGVWILLVIAGQVLLLCCCKSKSAFRNRRQDLLFILGPMGIGLAVWAFHGRETYTYFQQPLLVLKGDTVLREGNGTLYPECLPAPLPAGLCVPAAGGAGGWLRVEYAPGEYGWIPPEAATRVVDN